MISPHISYCKYSLALTDLLTNCQSSVFYSFSSWFPSHMHTLHLIDSIFTSGLVRASPSLLGLASPLCVPVQTMSQSDRWTGPVPWKLEQYSRDVTMHIQTRPWGSKGEKGDVQITAAVNLITVFLSCLSICLATCLPKAVPALMFGVKKRVGALNSWIQCFLLLISHRSEWRVVDFHDPLSGLSPSDGQSDWVED